MLGVCLLLAWQHGATGDGSERDRRISGERQCERGAWEDTSVKEIRGKPRRLDQEGGYLLQRATFVAQKR